MSTPPKKCKRITKFNDDWLKTKSWVRKVSDIKGFCTLCRTEILVSNKGVRALTDHESTASHQKNVTSVGCSTAITHFFNKKDTLEEDATTAAEVAHIYHCIKHNQSYNALDCCFKLTKVTHYDSKLGEKIHCGRTKAEAIVAQVLAPKELEKVLHVIHSNKLWYSVQTDASNHLNRTFFPLVLQYYTIENGIESKLVDFFEQPDETAEGMFQAIKESMGKLDLPLKKLCSFSADNTNSNFGSRNSVYVKLKNENTNILKANCYAHTLHNCLKHALDNLSLDINNIILKIYHFFAKSAKRRENLKSFYVFCDMEFRELIKHCPTRWLSILPAIDRILLSWLPLKEYFEHLSEKNELPKLYIEVFGIKNNKINESIEIYLLFVQHFACIFHETIKKLESNSTTILELFKILSEFIKQLEQRKNQQFYGSEIRKKFLSLDSKLKERVVHEFNEFINVAVNYIKQRIEDNITLSFLEQIHAFSLECTSMFPSFNKFIETIESLNLNDKSGLGINCDALFDEVISADEIYKTVYNLPDFSKLSCAEKWSSILKSREFPNLYKFISFFLSIPSSSAFSERVFSVMNIKWRDERNRALPELIRAELLVYFNSNLSCTEYFKAIKSDKCLLTCAKSNQKYIYKK